MSVVVGITSYVEQARWGVWDLPAVLLPLRYVLAVERAGGRAVVLPTTSATDPAVLDRLDAVIFAGGADLDPRPVRPAVAHRDNGDAAAAGRRLAGLPHMRRQRRGSIIITAPFVAVMGAATSQIAYTASKGAVLALSRGL